jgi:hypothetical protein
MSPKKDTPKPARRTTATNERSEGFTDEERAAMKERARELKMEARRSPRADGADGESELLAKIAEMPEPDRTMARRLHAKDGKVVCFFQSAQRFKARYATFGFSDVANLDDGAMWPTSFALKELTPAEETRIGELVKTAVS